MIDMLARNWGLVMLRGVVALLFGLFTLFNPVISLAALVLVFGAYAFADGIFTVIAAVANRRGEPHWVALLISGLAGIAAGLVTFFAPAITAVALLLLIAAWAIVNGIAEIVSAIRLRKVITNEWLLGLAGVLSLAFGVLLVAMPGAGALAVAIWIGAWATVMGVMLIALALRLRKWGQVHEVGATASTV